MPRPDRAFRTPTPKTVNPRLTVELLEDRAVPATFTVNTTSDTIDTNPGDGFALDSAGKTSLRAAVMEANALAGADTIQLPSGTFALDRVGANEAAAITGDLDIIQNLTITGAGASSTTIDAANLNDRVFDVLRGSPSSPLTLKIEGVTVTGGKAVGTGTSGSLEDRGGAIRMDFFTDVTITDSVFLKNSAPRTATNLVFGLGGAIDSSGKLTITGSTFDQNAASNSGGAIYVGGSGAVTVIKNSTFTSNSSLSGGAIKNHETMTVEASTFSGNTAISPNGGSGQGGAIDNNGGGNLTLVNTTVSGNSAVFGGAVSNAQSVKFLNSTIAGNSANYGGGLTTSTFGGASATFENTIIAKNTASTTGPDVDGTIRSLGHNLVGDTAGSSGWSTSLGDLLNRDPKLGSLADNSGPTKTRALLTGSPAIDAANTSIAPTADQRGVSRPQGTAADIGAFEVKANAAPVAADQSKTTDEDKAVTGTLTATDADGDTITFAIVTIPAHGTVQLNTTTGAYTYTPARNYNGSDSFTFKANDGKADSNVATVSITVNPVNDAPFPSPVVQNVTTAEDTVLSGQVKGTDVDGDTLTFTLVAGPEHGTLDLGADGMYTYTPAADYNGSDQFVFRVTDPGGLSNLGGVSITVTPVNDAPVAVDDSYSVDEDGTLSLTIDAVTRVRMVSDAGDFIGQGQTYDFTPSSASFSASKNFDNGVSLDVDPPALGEFWFLDFAAADEALLTAGVYLDAMRFPFQDAGHPGLDVSGNGRGSNKLTGQFTVYDVGFSGSAVTSFAAAFEQHSEGKTPALVGWVMYNSTFGAGGGVLTNDTDVEGDLLLGAALVSGPSNGTLTFNGDGIFTYKPNANFHGTDNFTYRTNDGRLDSNVATVTITVNSVNDAPVAVDDSATTDEDTAVAIPVLDNDTDVDGDALGVTLVNAPAHGTVELKDGRFTYAPDANFNGSDSFTYKLNDGSLDSNVATVSVIVNAVNDAPVAFDDSATTDEDAAVTVAVLGNDSDVDGDALTPTLASSPTHGSVVLKDDGSFTYTPDADFNGTDGFTYTLEDGNGGFATATVNVTVNAVNDAPVAVGDSAMTDEDTAVNIAVLWNDIDVEGDALTPVLVTNPAHGSVVLNADGSFTYRPQSNYNGTDSFAYKVSDGKLVSNVVTVSLRVNAANDAPVADDDLYTTTAGEPLAVVGSGVLGNDSDVDGDALKAELVSGPSHGTLKLNPDGSFVYTPAAGYSGSDSFTYLAGDGNLNDLATVTIQVKPATAPATEGKVTGSGSIDNRAKFNMEVQAREVKGKLVFSGDVSFHDYENGIRLESTSITYLRVESDGVRATISGTANVNGKSGYAFTIYLADRGESGRKDTFWIVITGPSGFLYDSSTEDPDGWLNSGNIQVHKTKK